MKLTHQVARFLVAGGVNTVVGYGAYALGILWLALPYAVAVMFSYAVGTTFAFFVLRRFVFTEGAGGWRAYLRFIRAYIALFFLNLGLMFVFVTLAGWGEMPAQALVIVICAAISFTVNKLHVFK